jgi:hypothetical protein
MKKLSILWAIICITLPVSAQDLLNVVFGKSLEQVNTSSKTEWYKGQILNKTRNGMGLCKWKDGTLYIGDFSKDEINGYGIQFVSEGQKISNCDNCIIYAGYWKNGVKQGEGTCYDVSGEVIYFGQFENDMPVESYPSKSDFSAYHFSFIDNDNGDIYFGETHDGILDGYGIYTWASGDLWFGKFADGQRKGVGIYLLYDAEWATLNCQGDNCTQITSSLENKERDEYNKGVKAKQTQRTLALLSELVTTVATGVSQVQNFNNSGTNYSSSGESTAGGTTNTGGGCNYAQLQSQYTRNQQKAYSAAGTAGYARGKEVVGAISGGQAGDNSTGNAAVKSSANQLVRTCEREMERLQQQAAKCGWVLR